MVCVTVFEGVILGVAGQVYNGRRKEGRNPSQSHGRRQTLIILVSLNLHYTFNVCIYLYIYINIFFMYA